MHQKEKHLPDHDRRKRLELTPRRQSLIWGAQGKQVEGGTIVEKQMCHTCSHSPDDWSLSLLAIHQDCEAVGVLHSRGQARYHDAARIRDDLPRSLSTLTWAHTQLKRSSKVCFLVSYTPIPANYQHLDLSSNMSIMGPYAKCQLLILLTCVLDVPLMNLT